MKKNYLLRIGVLIIGILLLTNCAIIEPINTSCVSYKSQTFQYSDLQNSKIAILPVLAGEGWEGFRRGTGDELTNAFRNVFVSQNILSPTQTLNLINDSDLSREYASVIEDYRTSGILNKKILKDLGEAVRVKYMVYSEVREDETLSSFSTGTYSSVYTKTKSANIYSQLWDIQTGDIVWEGFGGGAMTSTGSQPAVLNNLIKIASTGLAERIGKSINETPPCKNASDLITQVKSNYWNQYLLILGISTVGALIIMALI